MRIAVIGSGTASTDLPPHLADTASAASPPATAALANPRLSAFAYTPYERLVVDLGYVDAIQAAATPGAAVFHAATVEKDGRLLTAGGRVLTVVGEGPTFAAAIATAYDAVGAVRFEGMQYRTDIGRRAV